MWRVTAALGVAAIAIGAAPAAPLPTVPVDSRAEAVAQLKAAIEDELRVVDLIRKEPPRVETARSRIDQSRSRLDGVYDYVSTVPGGAAAEDAVAGARADDWASYVLISAPGARGAARPA
ncbi:MAG: hypothetical protein ACRDNB_00070 [Gaiellaceae bacterium]